MRAAAKIFRPTVGEGVIFAIVHESSELVKIICRNDFRVNALTTAACLFRRPRPSACSFEGTLRLFQEHSGISL